MGSVRVYLEQGQRWVFASAVDWPGWSRRGKGDEAALDALLQYAPRYSEAVGVTVPTGPLDVVGRIGSRSGMADFGAPGAVGPSDSEPLPPEELARQLALLDASWAALDREPLARSWPPRPSVSLANADGGTAR